VEISAWEAKRAGITDAIKASTKAGNPTEELEAILREIENVMPTPPRVAEILRGDDTPEALAYDLAKRWPAGAVISSEAGIFLGSAGMMPDRVMKNMGLLNLLWENGELPTGRRASESYTVRGARLTLSLQIQEDTLLEFFRKTGPLARGTGFLARFLFAWPESTQGHRPFSPAPLSWPSMSRFNARLHDLLRTPPPIQPDGTLKPFLLTFAPSAMQAWVAYHDQIEGLLGAGKELSTIKDIASKSADNAARLAALFHVFEHGPHGAISHDCIDRASQVAAWYLNESLRFFGGLALPFELASASRLEEWLLAYCREHSENEVPTKTVQQFGPSKLRNHNVLTAAIAELEEHGRVRLVKDQRKKVIRINPALLEK
jgi:putative DNA primase/helicase